MKITPKNVRRFQIGGQMGAEAPVEEPMMAEEEVMTEEPAPEQAGGQDPIMMLAQMSAQALQAQDCQMAMQVCEAFIQLIQQAQGGAAPAEPQGEPVFKKGGVLVRRIKK